MTEPFKKFTVLKQSESIALDSTQYSMLMGNYPAGNFPKEYVNEGASQLRKMSIALGQYKEDAEEQEYIGNLMAADVKTMRDKFTRYSEITKCTTIQLLCSLVVIDCDRILKNQNFNLNQLLQP